MMEIIHSDALSYLKTVKDESIDLVLTSPPYWGLRDYGIRDPNALGLEPEPNQYVSKLIEIMKECIRVLKPTGSIYLNLGDTYYNKTLVGIPWRVAFELLAEGLYLRNCIIWHKPNALPSSVKDRYTNTYEYVFFFTKQKKYYFNLDAVRIPHKTLHASGKKQRAYEKRILTKHEIAVGRLHASYTDPLHKHAYHELGKNPGDVLESKWTNPDNPVVEHFGMNMGDVLSAELQGQHLEADKEHADDSQLDTKSENNEFGDTVKIPSVRNKSWMSTPGHPYTHKKVWSDEYRELGSDYWSITTKPFKEDHFAVFPLDLCWRPILASCPPNGMVLDPFAGSGTVGEAVAILNFTNRIPTKEEVKKIRESLINNNLPIELKAKRRCILVDINERYVEIMKKRLLPYTSLTKLMENTV